MKFNELEGYLNAQIKHSSIVILADIIAKFTQINNDTNVHIIPPVKYVCIPPPALTPSNREDGLISCVSNTYEIRLLKYRCGDFYMRVGYDPQTNTLYVGLKD